MFTGISSFICALALLSNQVPKTQVPPPEYSELKPAPTNLYGAAVRAPGGAPIEYDAGTLEIQGWSWLAGGGSIPGPDFVTCESSVAKADWKYYAFGTGIGDGGFAVSAVGGNPEVIVACGGYGFGGNRYWMILANDPVANGYAQRFVSPVYTAAGVRWLAAADIDADPSPEIVVILTDGTVEIWDQAQRAIQGGFPTLASVGAMRLWDLDADGSLDLLVSTANMFSVYSLSGALKWSINQGGYDIAVGQMDADPALEVALTVGVIVDAGTHAVQWTWPSGFGAYLEAGDIDSDGKDELIATQQWGYSWAYDVDTQLPKWSLSLFNVGATHLTDINQDGTLDLIIGDAQWGDIHAYNATTLAPEWSINNPEHGTTEVIVGDADGDGDTEVIWGAGHTSSGPDFMYIANWQTGQVEWKNVHLDGPFRGPVRGDVDGDGSPEMVALSDASDSGYGAGCILVFDIDLNLKGISQDVAGGLGWSGTYKAILRNVDADPALEIVVATSTTYDGTIEIYKYNGGSSFTRIWEVPNPKPAGAFRDVELLDTNGDGLLDVIGCAGNYVYRYGLASGLQEWQSLAIVNGVVDIAVADTDNDPALEVLAVGTDGDLRIFDGVTGAVEGFVFGSFTCVEITPMVVVPDLIRLGETDGDLVTLQYTGGSYQQTDSVDLLPQPIAGITLGNAATIWASAGGVLSLFYPPYTAPLWNSCSVYGTPFGVQTAYGTDYVLTTGGNGVVAFRRQGQ